MPRIYFYIARKFWGPFLFALGVFAALVVLGDTFEKLKTLNNGYSTLGAVLSYSLATFPNWLATIMPVACLLGAISVISEMVANGEWTACVAGGFSPKQLFIPVVVCLLLVTGLTMLMQEFVVPPLNIKAETIYYTKIKPQEGFNLQTEYDVAMKISPHQMLYAKKVDLSAGKMEEISLDTYDSVWNISNQIVATSMTWDEDRHAWTFQDGTKRTFVDKMDTQEEHFDLADSPVSTAPADMSVNRTESKLLSIRDLSKRIRFFKQSGLAYYEAETVRQAKLATPFVTLIMCLLGIPFAISMRRKSKILNILASMVIAFTFWWLISMFTSIGENGYINPFLAGWGPVIVFGIVVFFEFKWLKL
ncbi:MAG: LptF/LptG family permease [Elusimicrobiaceae bacterium]|uniref:LptF/LptG family permease n=1 Tax=Candidatus Avelusimicrobium faecicola TaxID=3416205 RepID=UPI002A7A3733|nr:LptF/LptG family permease [Spirochaetota bacterium]MDY2940245.1 LptF/LptG family permease [Elusimicrobiaceae bacterium]